MTFYKTKLTVEFEIETQFGPAIAMDVIDLSSRVPAIKSVKVVKLETNYLPNPDYPKDINLMAMKDIPHKLK